MELTIEEKLVKWESAVKLMNKWRLEESKLRDELAAELFPNPKKGTNSFPLANNHVLKMVHKIYVNIDEAELTNIMPKLSPDAKNLAFSWKPKLNEKSLVALDQKDKRLIASVLTRKAGKASLEIVKKKR